MNEVERTGQIRPQHPEYVRTHKYWFGWMCYCHRNLRRMLQKGRFFQLVSNQFCVVRRRFVESCKMFLCCKLPCLGWRSSDFLQGFFFTKNVCWTSANVLVIVLRFPWLLPTDKLRIHKKLVIEQAICTNMAHFSVTLTHVSKLV
jgi:hypothetical protein